MRLPTAELSNKAVFLRADLNVPLSDGKILDDFRLQAIRPTLDLLLEKKARIILATHLGRPKGFDPKLTTHHLIPWFEKQGYSIKWAEDLKEAQQKVAQLRPGAILLLENLRFSSDEHDDPQESYAKELKDLADYYINDAWAVVHTKDASITLLPSLFDEEKKSYGLLIERELENLAHIKKPKRLFVMIMGGAKVTQKLPAVEKALDKANTVIILPPLSFTFDKAQGKEIGDSLVDDTLLPLAKRILSKAPDKLILPTDYLVGNDLKGPYETTSTIKKGQIGIALGPQSLDTAIQALKSAKTIFFNGTMGFFEYPDSLIPLKKLLQSIAQSNSTSVIGGGESVAAVNLFHLQDDITFCSTGGGATLQYILNGSLPGLLSLSMGEPFFSKRAPVANLPGLLR